MQPSKSKDLIKNVSENVSIPEDVCEIIIKEYWHRLRETLHNGEHAFVHVQNFGNFKIGYNSLLLRIKRYENLIAYYNRLDKKTKSSEAAKKRLSKLYILKEQLDNHYVKKQKTKSVRKELYKNIIALLPNP